MQPVWCIPVHLILSIILASLFYYLVEKPARTYFGPQNPRQFEPGVMREMSNSFILSGAQDLRPPERLEDRFEGEISRS